MSYRVEIIRSAEKEFMALPKARQESVRQKMLSLEANPTPAGSKKLRGSENHRLRSGEYRIIYSVDHSSRLAKILAIGHRKDVYRNL